MAEDDRRIDQFSPTTLIVSSLDTAIEHMHALSVLFMEAGVAHPHVPLTLLRASLEDASLALWLLAPNRRKERLTRALQVWHRDFADRGRYEKRVPQQPGKKTGWDRQRDMLDIATTLGLDAHAVASRLETTWLIGQAADVIGEKDETLRLWGLSSGLAHGRYWAKLKALEVIGAEPAPSGYNLQMVASEDEVVRLARICHNMITEAERLYDLRCTAP